MSEADLIARSRHPLTTPIIADQLRACGLKAGDAVLLHSSLSALGWVAGGAPAVINAFLHVLTPSGTLMVPAHSTDNTDPSRWQNPPVPPEWVETIRATMPAFHPDYYPTRMMGRIADTARQYPNAKRSKHPALSFAAIGAHADYLLDNHALDYPLGEGSPLARLYDLDGYVMLLGVDHNNNTSLHLAEYRAEWVDKIVESEGSAVLIDGETRWVEYVDINGNDYDFAQIGAAFERDFNIAPCQIGQAQTRLIRQRLLVDYATKWLAEHRINPPN